MKIINKFLTAIISLIVVSIGTFICKLTEIKMQDQISLLMILMFVYTIIILWSIHKKFTPLDRRLEDMLNNQKILFPIIMRMAEIIPGEGLKEKIIKQLENLNDKFISDALERERILMNPLSREELQRLTAYYERVRKNDFNFSKIDAEDFKQLANTLKEDNEKKGNLDMGAIVLSGIAGLVLGIIIGSSGKDKSEPSLLISR
ncbi:MAG: hypothetical protein ABH870_06660 [bacterium]